MSKNKATTETGLPDPVRPTTIILQSLVRGRGRTTAEIQRVYRNCLPRHSTDYPGMKVMNSQVKRLKALGLAHQIGERWHLTEAGKRRARAQRDILERLLR